MRKQRGLSLTSAVAWGVVLIFALLLTFAIGPAYMEYLTIQKHLRFIASDPESNRTRASVERAFDSRAAIDNMPSLSPSDLQIEKDGNEVTISASYSKRIPLFGNVSVCLDFNPSSAK
jgi:hypothetical protein